MALLDNQEMALLETATKQSLLIDYQTPSCDIAFNLEELKVAEFDRDDRFCTLSDVWNIYQKEIAGNEFEQYRQKTSWVWKCLKWAADRYGQVPVRIFLSIVNRNRDMRISSAEPTEIIECIPEDQIKAMGFDRNFGEYSKNN